jgi:hypothetical protein
VESNLTINKRGLFNAEKKRKNKELKGKQTA